MAAENRLLQQEVEQLRRENSELRRRDSDLFAYLRRKIDQLLDVVGTLPLRAEELSDDELIAFDPIGIISNSFVQVLQNLQSTSDHLRGARDEIAAIYNAVGAGIVVLDRDKRILSCNRRQQEIFFPGKRKILGQTCLSLLCKDKAAAPGCVFAKVMASGQSERTPEWAFNQRYFDVVGMPVKDRSGCVQQVVIVYHEVTERKAGEEELFRAFARAVVAQQNTEAIVNSVHEGLLVIDRDGTLLLANPAALQILRCPAAELPGRKVSQLFSDSTLAARWEEAIEGNAVGEPFDCQRQEGANDHPRCYQSRIALLYEGDGSVRGGIVTLRDVTLERELERMKSEFVSTAAHELRTPLTAILGFSELLLDPQSFSPHECREFVTLIHDKAEKLSELIDELLDIGRIEAGKVISLTREALPLAPLAMASLDFFRRSSGRHQFQLLVPEEEIVVDADPRRLSQVFDNLLSNAVKYSPAGGVIALRIDPGEMDCTISVSDEGIGMNPEAVARIFDKFYRVDGANTAVPGVGLGMTIVRELIEGHGSRVAIASTPGEGTTVSFTLPYAGGSDPDPSLLPVHPRRIP